jgi:hypothetical protein
MGSLMKNGTPMFSDSFSSFLLLPLRIHVALLKWLLSSANRLRKFWKHVLYCKPARPPDACTAIDQRARAVPRPVAAAGACQAAGRPTKFRLKIAGLRLGLIFKVQIE